MLTMGGNVATSQWKSGLFALSFFLFLTAARGAGPVPSPTPVPHPTGRPLGIALEEVEYPWPVHFLPLTLDGQDLRMAYMDVAPTGAANGRTVLLLHGKNFSGEYWESTARFLAAAGFRVVVPDQIGFGKSSIAEIRYSFDRLAANTAKLLDSLEVQRVSLIGHSMGGMLAVRFVRNFPTRSEALVLANPIGLEDYRAKLPAVPLESIYAQELANTDPEKIGAFYRRYFAEWKSDYERFPQTRARIAGSGDFPRYAMVSALTYEMVYEQPVRHEFSLIQTPTLLVIGQADRTTIGRGLVPEEALQGLGNYPALGKAAAADIPRARLVELPNVGHLPQLEAPDRFRAAVLEFLGAAR
jgi:pimeloyl-ACP methyl ester carboxylesterase